jgi:chromosomal replication initiation ATPase DnaA
VAAPSNAAARRWLEGTAAWPQGRLALWGPEGCGKTHLVHVWAEAAGAEVLAGPVLAEAEAPPQRPVALDDADAAPERPLLHLLNAAAEAHLPVLLAAREAPARWRSRLADLASRLAAITAVAIGPAEEMLLERLFARLLAEQQLTVPAALQGWMLERLPRTQAAVREAAARLDHAALAAGGVSRALAAAIVGGFEAEPDGSESLASPEGEPLL